MVFCIPLNSTKEKHFKTVNDFNSRNYLELRYQNLVYIDQTDSIALLDQMRSISIKRLLSTYYDIVLNDKNIQLLSLKAIKYFKIKKFFKFAIYRTFFIKLFIEEIIKEFIISYNIIINNNTISIHINFWFILIIYIWLFSFWLSWLCYLILV